MKPRNIPHRLPGILLCILIAIALLSVGVFAEGWENSPPPSGSGVSAVSVQPGPDEGDAPSDDGVTVTVDDPVVNIADEDTPLAAGGEHICCVLHFLLLCAALVMELVCVSRGKKRQQKIFKMRRELGM